MKVKLILGFSIAMLMLASALFCQEYRATLMGRVLDSTSAAVPAARVTATNIATGVVSTTDTNSEGNYTIPYLQPGQYRVRVESQGFKAMERNLIELRTNERVQIDVQMELGAHTETVNVTAETPLLDVMGASAGQVLEKTGIEDLPFAKGVAYHLMSLSPGLTLRGTSVEENPYDWSVANFVVSGSSDTSAISIDGVITGGLIAGSKPPSFSPPQESVGEFNVQSTAFDAAQGFTQSANLNISIKSGTNAPHGAFYYTMSRPEFSANTFMNTVHGVAKPDASYSRLGGAFGGPVEIPGVYHGKNRTFFFISPERIHLHQIYGRTYTVPMAKERTGDFSDLLSVGAQYQIYDPATRRSAPNGRFLEDPFPGNIIPPARISPIAAALLKYWPMPNLNTVAGANNYASPTDGKREWYWAGVVRVDHNLSARQRLFFSAHHYHRNNEDAPCFQEAQKSAGCGLSWVVNPAGGAFDDVYTFGASFVMDVRVGYERYPRTVDYLPWNQVGSWSYAAIGMPAVLDSYTTPAVRRMPGFSPSGYTGIPSYSDIRYDVSDIWSPSINFTKTHGSHTFRFGVEGRMYRANVNAPGKNTTGTYTFGNDWTLGPYDNSAASPLGQGLAGMLLGLPTAGEIDVNPTSANKSYAWGGFFQEDFRVTPRLTLNLGLRYEYTGPTVERYNRSVTGFDPTAAISIAAQAQANYAKNPTPEVSQLPVQGGLLFAGVKGQSNQLWKADKNNLLPRFGLAYTVTPKTVIRGGFGLYYMVGGVMFGTANQTGFSQQNLMVPSLDGGLTFAATLANPFPSGIQNPAGSALGADTFVGKAISFYNPNLVIPYMERWQLGMQRQLPWRALLDVSYAGSRGTKLYTTRNLDATPLKYLSTSPARDNTTNNYLTTNVANPFYPLLPGTSLSGSVIARSQLLLPYPQFTSVSTSTNEGYSWYHSLQVRVERRLANGFNAQLGYTFSKYMQATTFLNAADPRPERVISSFDFPQSLTGSVIYELPLGHGHKLLGNVSKGMDYIFGKWQLEAVYRYQSGLALGFGNSLLTGQAIPLPSDQRNINQWFNVNAFVRPSSSQLVNNVITLSSRFSNIRSDGLKQTDLSALKRFVVREWLQAEVRAEFLNAFNAVYLGAPNTSPTSSAFGTITSELGAPRNVNLGVRVRF